jgi:hypothetical protein
LPTTKRRQADIARQAGLSQIATTFLAIVNDGRVTFASKYVQAARPYQTTSVVQLDLVFDPANPLHAEVYHAAIAIADALVADAEQGRDLPEYVGRSRILPKGYLLDEIRAADIGPKEILQQQVVNGTTYFRRDPQNAIDLAARSARLLVRDAVAELVDTGGYRRLRRCRLDACRRLFFATNDSRAYHSDPCRWAANRPRTRNALKGQSSP